MRSPVPGSLRPRIDVMVAASVGKRVRGALYVHVDALDLLPEADRGLVSEANDLASDFAWNIVRIGPGRAVGLLCYPGFETEGFPKLHAAATVDLVNGKVRKTSYVGSANPLVLHRKELLVGDRHPRHDEWLRTTQRIEALGLLFDKNRIGRLSAWSAMLDQAGLDSDGLPFR